MAEEVAAPPSLGDVLLKQGKIDQDQLRRLLAAQEESGQSIGRLAVSMRVISEAALIQVLKMTYGLDLLNLAEDQPDPSVGSLIPKAFAEKFHVVPIRKDKDTLVVAMQDPSDGVVIDAIKHQVKMDVVPLIAKREDMALLLEGPEAAHAAKKEAKKQRGPIHRVLSTAAFPILAAAPLLAFFPLVVYSDDFQTLVLTNMPSKFDLMMYVGLGWGLWAIILWEINGLIFGRDEDE